MKGGKMPESGDVDGRLESVWGRKALAGSNPTRSVVRVETNCQPNGDAMHTNIPFAAPLAFALACHGTAQRSAYHLTLTGRDTSGAYAWAGPVHGAITGRATVAVRFEERPGPKPGVGFIDSHWVVSATPASNSFEASLSGTGDMVSGRTHLVGTIINGAGRGQKIETESNLAFRGPSAEMSGSDGVITIRPRTGQP
jgi:hypothetical protein